MPVYGVGDNIRDWLYVEDHAEALRLALAEGQVGQTYNIGGRSEKANLQVVETICTILQELTPSLPAGGDRGKTIRYRDLVTFVADRPGHDRRYAIDASKIDKALGWKPKETFETGMRKTVQWYLDNEAWWRGVLDGSYQRERLGLTTN